MTAPGTPSAHLRVMHTPTDDSNPFFSLLTTAMPAGVVTIKFSWSVGLSGRFDVLHIHWPERLFRDASWRGTLRKRVLTLVLLVLVRFRGVPVVRTLHNSTPHDAPSWSERVLLRLFDRATTMWVRMSEGTRTANPARTRLIPHGDYAGAYAFSPHTRPDSTRLLYFGRIRPYKGVEALLDAVRQAPRTPFRLRIVGRPTTRAIRSVVEEAVTHVDGVSARLEFVPDDDLVAEIEHARAVCLPYRSMENSGALLLALTAGRPAIVPRSPVNELLAQEVGESWVVMYDGELDHAALTQAWARLAVVPDTKPDLTHRAWPQLGLAYADVYAEARLLMRAAQREH